MIEQILSQLTAGKVLILLGAFLVVRHVTLTAYADYKIRKLGHRAPSRFTFVPFGLNFIYSAIKAAREHKNLELWRDLMLNYGNKNNPYTVESSAGGRRIILTADPDNIKAILATQFGDYGKGEPFHQEWKDFLGDSIFVTDGQLWHNSRQLIRPQFIKDRLSDIHTFETHVQKLIPKFRGRANGASVNVSDLFFKYTLDAATDFLLGKSVDSLEMEENKFANDFAEVQRIQSIITRAGSLNWLIPRKNFYACLGRMEEFLQPIIERTIALSPEELESKGKTEEGYTFLHALANYTKDKKVLRDQLVAVLLAGRDTTACTLMWTIHELSHAPNVVKKLREEILAVVGPTRQPSYEDLKSMRYLQHVINEILRLYPVVPFNVRLALKDTTLPRGGGPDGNEPIGILKDTPIGYSTLLMQRRPDLYPSESSGFPPVNSFVPERWDGWTPKSWTYIPFNGGPRICIGQQFALTEMGYTLTRVFQTYTRVEDRMGGVMPRMRADIVLQPAEDVMVEFFQDKE
ncbi:cytochrome P450 [Eremomyces bilateralis CBS 781.70]|uniref:Cytochrome P450 n=1 Tax=Eremomyces bilateralis CBS 781.70 TaxID=1392243 RepID=A0A6G1FU08_9PEZI|nr:cytochrome P450 [Eremomyces bilateralis CBS 781.70]KAF1809375.1 cytochrome P450 [Eremomyces bilateralis CBS 781.70]